MNTAELTSVRGVPAVPVAFRTAALMMEAKRDFIWYLQGLSLKDGGFKRIARELLEMFPERVVDYEIPDAEEFLASGAATELFRGEPPKPAKKVREDIKTIQARALAEIEPFLTELCTNPKLQFSLPGMDSIADEFEDQRAIETNPGLSLGDFRRAELTRFRDIIGALVEYRARREKKIRDNFHLTAIGKQIWETLNFALSTRSMVLLDGLEGRGKTEAVKAWCELHSGRARFVSLKGVTTKTTIFREISMALGISSAYGRTGPEMQSRIEDVLNRSKIMLLIDEAHFLFNQSRRMTSRPEMIDWLDTAICNRGVPVALVTTPQFIQCMSRAKNQVEWNFNQFRRRVKRWVKLPDKNCESDIFAVARNVFQNAGESVIKKVAGYALLSRRDLSAIGDIAAEVRYMIGSDDLSRATVAHIDRTLTEFLIGSDLAFKVSLEKAEADQRRGRTQPTMRALPVEVEEPETSPAMSRPRSGLPVPAMETADLSTNRGSLKANLTAA